MRTRNDIRRALPTVVAAAIVAGPTFCGFGMNTCPDESPPDINKVQLSWQENAWTTIPFNHGVNHVLIEVEGATGETYTFFVDTGASLTVVTPEFLDVGGTTAFSEEAEVQAFGASGQIAGAPRLIQVQNLLIGTLLVEEAAAVVVDLDAYAEEMGKPIHGIIGFNLLSQMTTVIDYQNGTISFIRSGTEDLTARLGSPDSRVPFNLRMGALIEVVGHVNDGPVTTFIFDIGSRYSGLNQTASESSAIDFEPLPGQPSSLGLGEKEAGTVASGMARSLRIGGLMLTETRLYSLDLPVFSTLGLDGQNAGLLGNDLLQRYTVAIDYSSKQLSFWSPSG